MLDTQFTIAEANTTYQMPYSMDHQTINPSDLSYSAFDFSAVSEIDTASHVFPQMASDMGPVDCPDLSYLTGDTNSISSNDLSHQIQQLRRSLKDLEDRVETQAAMQKQKQIMGTDTTVAPFMLTDKALRGSVAPIQQSVQKRTFLPENEDHFASKRSKSTFAAATTSDIDFSEAQFTEIHANEIDASAAQTLMLWVFKVGAAPEETRETHKHFLAAHLKVSKDAIDLWFGNIHGRLDDPQDSGYNSSLLSSTVTSESVYTRYFHDVDHHWLRQNHLGLRCEKLDRPRDQSTRVKERHPRAKKRHSKVTGASSAVNEENDHTLFPCTLKCGLEVPTRSEWERHEERQSLPSVYICSACPPKKNKHPHVFRRADHLRAHVKSKHSSFFGRYMSDVLEHSQHETGFPVPTWCGFCCKHKNKTWKERHDHIADHFVEEHRRIKDWQPELDPSNDSAPGSDDDDDDDFPPDGNPGGESGPDADSGGGSSPDANSGDPRFFDNFGGPSSKDSDQHGGPSDEQSRFYSGHHPGTDYKRRSTNGARKGTLDRSAYEIGWISALPIERTAARAMLDEEHNSLPNNPNDTDGSKFGSRKWFFDTAAFRSWADQGNRILRLNGLAGSGKSMMASMLTDSLNPGNVRPPNVRPPLGYQRCLCSQTHSRTKRSLHAHLRRWHSSKLLGVGSQAVVDEIAGPEGVRLARKTTMHDGPRAWQTFINEHRALQRMDHQHIVRSIGAYSTNTGYSQLLSPVADANLRSWLDTFHQTDAIEVDKLLSATSCLASALKHIHGVGMWHQDLKPGNVLVMSGHGNVKSFSSATGGVEKLLSAHESSVPQTQPPHTVLHHTTLQSHGNIMDLLLNGKGIEDHHGSGSLRFFISDFGLSSLAADYKPGITRRKGGTPHYAPPEPFASASADTWSLGCIFVEIATVALGYTLGDLNAFLLHRPYSADIERTHRWLRVLKDEANGSIWKLIEVIEKMLARNPADRPTSRELIRFLPRQCSCQEWDVL